MQTTEGFSLRTLVLTAAGCSAVTAIAALYAGKQWSRSISAELAELQKQWSALQHTIASLPIDTTYGGDMGIPVGSHVVVKEFGEVANSSLWDTSNTQYCERSGTVMAIDADGDATVLLDDGEQVVIDVKFLVSTASSDLKSSMHAMQGAIRDISTAVGRAPPPVVFE